MNLAIKITIGRILLIPFFIASIVYSRMDAALLIFIIAVITDGVDGYIARRQKQKTRLGTILDPLADKLLLVSAFICLAMVNNIPEAAKFPPYVPIVVISRDAIIVLGSILIYIMTGDLKIKPTIIGKLTTVLQMATIISVLIHFAYSSIVWNVAVFFTFISGIDYVVRGSKLMNTNHNRVKEAGE
jgi:cardiolipin synthase